MTTHLSVSTGNASLAPAWMQNIKKSNPSTRWAIATMISVLSLVGGLNGKIWCIVFYVVMHIIALVSVKRLHGQSTRGSAKSWHSKLLSWSMR